MKKVELLDKDRMVDYADQKYGNFEDRIAALFGATWAKIDELVAAHNELEERTAHPEGCPCRLQKEEIHEG